jgi:Tubulin binding cofactor A
MSAEVLRSLKIKTGAVKRTTKEYMSYHNELEREQQRLESMRAAGKDEYDIKQQENVIQARHPASLHIYCQRSLWNGFHPQSH